MTRLMNDLTTQKTKLQSENGMCMFSPDRLFPRNLSGAPLQQWDVFCNGICCEGGRVGIAEWSSSFVPFDISIFSILITLVGKLCLGLAFKTNLYPHLSAYSDTVSWAKMDVPAQNPGCARLPRYLLFQEQGYVHLEMLEGKRSWGCVNPIFLSLTLGIAPWKMFTSDQKYHISSNFLLPFWPEQYYLISTSSSVITILCIFKNIFRFLCVVMSMFPVRLCFSPPSNTFPVPNEVFLTYSFCILVIVRFSGCFAALWKEVCGKAI